LITAQLAVGRVRARRGDPDAWAALDEAAALAGQTATLQRLGPVHGACAEAAWLAGDSERAAAEAGAAFDLAVAKTHAWFAGELAYWLWKAGVLGSPPEHMAEPFALQIAGDPLAAARLWDERLCPYEAARARIESDDPAEVSAALTALERLGARPLAQVAARKLRELGVRATTRGPRQSTREHPAGLTTREAECLRLIAEGCRNAEIAERLFLSQKTIERHIGNLFVKLDVHSRTELLSKANRLGLISQTEGAASQN
jgi:DNA-binding CsgD family transcriptional regulator